MPHDVFISYANNDKTIADAVCAKLEEKKIRCWISPRDILVGANFDESIIKSIELSKILVLIWSASANSSIHVMNEINQAFDKGIIIIPFRIEDVQPTPAMRYYFGRTHWLDAITPPLEKHIIKLVDTIQINLGRQNEPAQPTIDNGRKHFNLLYTSFHKKIGLFILACIILLLLIMGFYKYILPNLKYSRNSEKSSVLVSEKDGMILQYVPAGSFYMGSSLLDTHANEDEFPQHSVYLDSFWIDRNEVTNEQYRLCVNDGICDEPGNAYYYSDTVFNPYPITFVNWFDAQQYCQWAGRRLPTEAEWEKAARGTEGQLYPWGNDPPNDNLYNHHNADTMSGSFPLGASPYGVLDMAGNVWEWTSDWYQSDYYKKSNNAENPTGPDEGYGKVRKGGAWGIETSYLRAAVRGWNNPNDKLRNLGFRCVKDSILDNQK